MKTLIILTSLLAATVSFCQVNNSVLEKMENELLNSLNSDEIGNSIVISQEGSRNTIMIEQSGDSKQNNNSVIKQSGEDNTIQMLQENNNNTAVYKQNGSSNTITSSTSGENNLIIIDQEGNNNTINQETSGNDNQQILEQTGSNLELILISNDVNNTDFTVEQEGKEMKVIIEN